MNIPNDEQIAAILRANEWKLAKQYGLNSPIEIKWTVTKEDVRQYIDKNGIPEGWASFSKNSCDGLHILKNGNEWMVYFQERGAIYHEDKFATEDQALDFLLETYYLKRFGIV